MTEYSEEYSLVRLSAARSGASPRASHFNTEKLTASRNILIERMETSWSWRTNDAEAIIEAVLKALQDGGAIYEDADGLHFLMETPEREAELAAEDMARQAARKAAKEAEKSE